MRDVLARPSAFGENLSTRGIIARDARIGDVCTLGGATPQVPQSRQPRRKLNARFGFPQMSARARQSGRTGWRYRVLDEGWGEHDGELALRERPHPQWHAVEHARRAVPAPARCGHTRSAVAHRRAAAVMTSVVRATAECGRGRGLNEAARQLTRPLDGRRSTVDRRQTASNVKRPRINRRAPSPRRAQASAQNVEIACATRAAASRCGKWPTPSSTARS